MKLKKLFNPFAYFSEITLLIIGILFIIIALFSSPFFNALHTGIFQVAAGKTTSWKHLLMLLSGTLVPFLLLFIMALFINKKTRWIDILNTALIARIPCYVCIPLIIFAKKIFSVHYNDPKAIPISSWINVIVFTMLNLLVFAFSLVLYYNGFKTSTNARKWEIYVLFFVVLIIADILTLIINYHFILP
ncbi:MAG: hypothetical protein PW786_14230 [Arachidicoccus sp.]|nr:hypothetical protein [Arachidicoccus sp.]